MSGPTPGAAPAAASPALAPHLAGLLDGLPSGEPLDRELIGLAATAGLSSSARVLDPACGRGGAALALAEALGCHVDGVDEAPDLVAAAEGEALRRGLPCRFRTGAPPEALEMAAGHPRDAVLWLGMGWALGDPAATVAALRAAVRPDGLLLVEDAVLRDGAAAPAGEPRLGRREALAALAAHGDEVVAERPADDAAVRSANRRDLATLRERAAALGAREPALAPALEAWLAAQEERVAALERSLRTVAWVLRRRGG